jgi:hypothetical protein
MTHINSVDATTGQPMIARVLSRKAELEAIRQTLRETDLQTLSDIDVALQTIDGLLTGDHANIPPVVVADMNRWLERSKHLAERPIDDGAPEQEAAAPVDGEAAPVEPETQPLPPDSPDGGQFSDAR